MRKCYYGKGLLFVIATLGVNYTQRSNAFARSRGQQGNRAIKNDRS